MDEDLIGFIALVLLVLSSIVLGLLISVRRTVKTLRLDQLNLSMRLDSLKQELKRDGQAKSTEAAPQPKPRATIPQPAPAPAARTPAIDMPPPLPLSLPPPVAPRAKPIDEKKTVPPSKFAESAREILTTMWNWIKFGQDTRPEGVTLEYAVASAWLPRLFIVVGVTGVVWFLKWSIEKELVGPAARVAISALVGVGLAIWGMKLLGKKYHVIGQGLLGGGLLIMYLSAYAAGPTMYRLFDAYSLPATFGLMILITLAAGILAVRTNSLLIAIVGLVGGYLTPVMLRSPTPNLPVFYSYMLLLGLGILVIANYKQWRLLNYLGFVFTYVLFLGSLSVYQKADFPVAISFLSAFFVLHSSLVYLHNLVRRTPSSTLEIIHVVANAAVYAGIAYTLIKDAYGRPYPAIMSLALAVFFIIHVLGFLQRKLQDRPLLISLIALSGVFATWTLPLVLEKESLTIALSLLAVMFLWLGQRLSSNFLQNLGHGVYLIVFVRLLALDLPRNFDHHVGASLPLAEYWKLMSDRLVTFGSCIASIAAAFFIQRKGRPATPAPALLAGNDTPEIVKPNLATVAFYWFGILFTFLFLHLELNRMFVYWDPLRLPVLTVLWCAMAAYFLWKHFSEDARTPVMFIAACIFIMVGLVKIFAIDLQSWHFCDSGYFNMEYAPLYVGMRFMDFGVLLAMLFTVWWLFTARSRAREQTVAPVFGYGGLLLLFLYASMELNSLLHWTLPKFQTGGISILWALFAIAFITGGIWKNVAPLRYIGLILFCIVVGKVFLVDLEHMEMIYRVIAFIAVSIFLLLGSFAYIRSSRKFTRDQPSMEERK